MVKTEIIQYVKKRMTRFLLLAVILTAGLTLRSAAYGKYVSYLNDITSAVAGDFFFTSNYLTSSSEGGATYNINSWNGESYDIDVEIRSYENSLRFNGEGTDCFYHVDAYAYYIENGEEVRDELINNALTIKYGQNNANLGATQTVTETITNEDGTETQKTENLQYGFLPGQEEYDAKTGVQTVNIKFKRTTALSNLGTVRYLKITAYTVPTTQVGSLTRTSAAALASTTDRGVYYEKLEATFALKITASNAAVIGDYSSGGSSDYTVRYRIKCNSAASTGGSVSVKVYYDSEKVNPDVSLGNTYRENTGTYAYTSAKKWRYVQVTVNVGGSLDLYFYKKAITVVTDQNDFGHAVITSDDEDTNYYGITSATGVSGGYVSKIANSTGTEIITAQKGTTVYVTLTPNTGYTVEKISVVDSDGNELTTSAAGTNCYSFTMTNSQVTITPSFYHSVEVSFTGSGQVSTSVTGANQGAVVYITLAAAEGYELSTLTVNNSAAGLTKYTEVLYSFVMPNTTANVVAVFTETQTE